jgi:hypothetical protein
MTTANHRPARSLSLSGLRLSVPPFLTFTILNSSPASMIGTAWNPPIGRGPPGRHRRARCTDASISLTP